MEEYMNSENRAAESAARPEQGFDELLRNRDFQAEFDRRVSRALETARGKWAQDVQQQDADTWPKTFTITLGGDTTLGSTDDLRKRDDCFEKIGRAHV